MANISNLDDYLLSKNFSNHDEGDVNEIFSNESFHLLKTNTKIDKKRSCTKHYTYSNPTYCTLKSNSYIQY